MLLKTRAGVKLSTPEDLLRFIVQYGEYVFRNLRVGLQFSLTVATRDNMHDIVQEKEKKSPTRLQDKQEQVLKSPRRRSDEVETPPSNLK